MEPSWGDRGSIALGVVFVYLVPQSDLDCILDDVMLYLSIV